jgi:hypothetical protein
MSYEEVEDCMPAAWKAAPDATSHDIANVRVNFKSTQKKIDGDAPVLGGTALAEYMEALPKLLAKAAGFNYTRDESPILRILRIGFLPENRIARRISTYTIYQSFLPTRCLVGCVSLS